MSFTNANFIKLEDLYVAYRKAKVDAFYERDHVTALSFAQFESRLSRNLKELLAELNSPSPTWMNDSEFVGTYSYIPKSIKIPDPNKSQRAPIILSDPDKSWRAQCLPGRRAEARFRIVGRHPVNYHIVSALWILKVGHLFDAVLKPCAYASRVRRRPPHAAGGYGGPSKSSLGSFRPYSFGFRDWRADGLKAMRAALEQKKPILAITADLRSFYHEVSPTYLTSRLFWDMYSVRLTENQQTFTEQFVQSLTTWARETPEHQNEPLRGIPVGLSAPRLIANVLLHEFDEFVTNELSPIYYGRYVDDVFLVLENGRGFLSAEEVWKMIISRSSGLIEHTEEAGEPGYKLNFSYSPKSRLRFVGAKQKVFSLAGTSGGSLLDAVIQTVTRRSSDWRLLPDLPTDEQELATDFLNAGRDATEEVDNLRKADGITVQRLAFALRLRNFEAVRRDLLPSQWKDHREKFYQIVLDHVVTAPGIFAYSPYIARLLSLAVSCGDWQRAADLVTRVAKVFELVRETSDAIDGQLNESKRSVLSACYEAVVKGLGSFKSSPDTSNDYGLNLVLQSFKDVGLEAQSVREISRDAVLLLQCDLGYDAYRDRWVNGDTRDRPVNESMIALPISVRSLLKLDDAKAFLTLANFPRHSKPNTKGAALPRAVVFPTRPFTTAEITLLDQECLRDWDKFRRWVRALRGTEFDLKAQSLQCPTPNEFELGSVVSIPYRQKPRKPLVALPAFSTEEGSWNASVMEMTDPDAGRYFRINRLINDALKAHPRPTYFVLPELALPRKWFNLAAHRLAHSGVSLVAGLEYEHHGEPRTDETKSRPHVSNQVRASLVTDLLGYPSLVIYEQEKERAAPEEAELLRQVAGKELMPKKPVVRSVIQHADFHFGILICSELTNIQLRAKFRGLVDALIVPEWNQDTNSFSSLVESAALDVHCFVVQVNNRRYGDCRVRAPYKDEFRRDIARVKGGKADYYVLAELDVQALRSFQSLRLSPSEPEFKPKPDGFEINPRRRRMPD